nr:glycosyltransferase [uncultured Acetatifactor sp.]
MRIVQIASILACGDGISNCALALADLLEEAGYQNVMASNYVDPRLQYKEIIEFDYVEDFCLDMDDIIVYHFSIGANLNRIIEELPNKKILVYHNVTPGEFFRGVDDELMVRCLWGILDAENTAGNYLKCIAMSEFSKADLVRYGWNETDIETIPLIAGFREEICARCDKRILERYSDGLRNFLFVGRIVPHKKIEDIIRIFAYYQKNIYCNTRLILIGSIGYKNYYNALEKYIEELGVRNVILTGHVPNEELEAYYAVSDLFLCMSEHEGFCMPLIEAMGRGIPVLAYAAAAVPETMGNAGILLESKEEEAVCRHINHIFQDNHYRENLIKGEQERVAQVNIDRYRDKLFALIHKVIDIGDYTYKSEQGILKIGTEITLINQWENLNSTILIQNDVPIILYGIGKVGRKLYAELVDGGCRQIAACCDNSYPEETFGGVPVLKHELCVKRYPKAVYIITIQRNHVQIVVDLVKSGINENQIVFWGNKKGFYV